MLGYVCIIPKEEREEKKKKKRQATNDIIMVVTNKEKEHQPPTIHEMHRTTRAERKKVSRGTPVFHHQTPPLHACRYSSR
jgi:hypothetical protein